MRHGRPLRVGLPATRTIVVAIAFALCWPGVGVAAADWSPPRPLGDPGEQTWGSVQLAGNRSGNVLSVWRPAERGPIRAQTATTAGELRQPITVWRGHQLWYCCDVTVADDGTGLITWQRSRQGEPSRHSGLYGRLLTSEGRAGRVLRIAGSPRENVTQVCQAAAPDGTMLVAWQVEPRPPYAHPESPYADQPSLWYRMISPAGRLSRAARLSGRKEWALDAGCAFTGRRAVLAWVAQLRGRQGEFIRSRTVEGRTRTAIRTVANNRHLNAAISSGLERPRVTVDAASGRALVTWAHEYLIGQGDLYGRWLAPTGMPLGRQMRIDTEMHCCDYAVAAGRGGRILVAWEDWHGSPAVLRETSGPGQLGPLQTLSPPGEDAAAVALGVADDGNVVVTWNHGDDAAHEVRAATRSSDGTVSPPVTLSSPGQDASAFGVVVDGSGRAMTAFPSGRSPVAVSGP